jgi:hypothetical protein
VPQQTDAVAATFPAHKKKRARGRRRKQKSRNKAESIHKKQPTTKKTHDAPMKKRDLYFSLTCSMVGIKGGKSVVARVCILNWDMDKVLDTFVNVPVPVTDFKDSGISPDDIRKSRTNLKARSFSEVRQLVDQTLRGKILIGHQLSEKLIALGLTHPSSDVRDTAIFFRDPDLSKLSQTFLKKPFRMSGTSDFSLTSGAVALDLYKTYRKEWEQDLIKNSQECEQQLLMQMKNPAPPSPPRHNLYHNDQEQQRPRFPSYETVPPNNRKQQRTYFASHEMTPPMMQAYPQHGASLPTNANHDNASWFVRRTEYPAMHFEPQSATTPALSSKAMQALSSYEHSPRSYDNAITSSYDGSIYESSTDYTGSYFEATSLISESVATASIASSSMQEEAEAPAPSSSWFRFGSRKSSSTSKPISPQMEHMTSVSEEEEASAPTDAPNDNNSPYEPPRYFTNDANKVTDESSKQSSSWFAFRKSKSPKSEKAVKEIEEEEDVDPLNSSRSHGCPDLASLSLEDSKSQSSDTPSPASFPTDESRDLPEIGAKEDEKSSSSWFKFRRSGRTKQGGEEFGLEQSQSSHTDDEDWLQEVMGRKPAAQSVRFKQSSSKSSDKAEMWKDSETPMDSLENQPVKDSSSNWFRFLRSQKSSLRDVSRLATADDDRETLPVSSFEDDTDGWIDQVMNSPSEGWSDAVSVAATGGLFLPPARPRFPTESTIQSVVSEEEEDSLSHDLLEGMEQNLAFLNI